MNNLFALVEKDSKRAVCIFDSEMLSFYKEKLSIFDLIEVESVGTTTFSFKENGSCSAICISPKNKPAMKNDYFIVKSWTDKNLSLGEIYKLIG